MICGSTLDKTGESRSPRTPSMPADVVIAAAAIATDVGEVELVPYRPLARKIFRLQTEMTC